MISCLFNLINSNIKNNLNIEHRLTILDFRFSVISDGNGGPTGVKCPEKDCDGEIVERRSKRGKIFYGCSSYPKCTFASWNKPVPEECPLCGAEFLIEKSTKKEGTFLACNKKSCKYKRKL